jgi:hypothetical protein
MPRDGANILSEVRDPVLTVVCEPCGLRERYDVERLRRQYGWDAKLTAASGAHGGLPQDALVRYL